MKKYLSILQADPNFAAGLRFPLSAGAFAAGLVASPFVGAVICARTGWNALQEKSEEQSPDPVVEEKVVKATKAKPKAKKKAQAPIQPSDMQDDLAGQPAPA